MNFCAGEWVEVRSREDILRELDANGRLGELPFMPQMLQYCGQRFRVYKSAYKTCDTVSGHYVGRSLSDGVHLNLRCDGQAFGGCQAGCLIFWKKAWLKSVDGPGQTSEMLGGDKLPIDEPCRQIQPMEANIWEATKHKNADGETRYYCQATELLNYTTPLKWWDARQYLEAYSSGNRGIINITRGILYLLYYYLTLAFSDRWGSPSRWLYNRFQATTNGTPFPRLKGKIAIGQPTPRRDLDLRPGDLVRVRPYAEILATVDTQLSNRGLSFDAELVPFCGKVFHVSARVERFIDEKSGKMRRLKTPAVILEGVVCKALFSGQRMFCPRSIHLWWREIWLERASIDTIQQTDVTVAGESKRHPTPT